MEKVLSLQEVYVGSPVLRIDAVLRQWCRILAATGGVILTGVTLVTVASVIGRTFFNSPVPGDFELVELGAAVAVSLFLPYCQIHEGNVIVDIFTAKASPGVIRILGALGDLLFLVISALLCWRLVLGCLEYREYEEVTMVLQIPIWWAMAPMIVAFALLNLTCASTMLTHLLVPRGTAPARKNETAAPVPAMTHKFAMSRPEGQK
jgi:TRAP-type C4-dicarboxylate transport system permease small subunit